MTRRPRALIVLLVLPFIGTLLPFLYNRELPAAGGMPFFYWYQLLWVVITSALLGAYVFFGPRGDDAE
jgi:pilus assembly protein TadC